MPFYVAAVIQFLFLQFYKHEFVALLTYYWFSIFVKQWGKSCRISISVKNIVYTSLCINPNFNHINLSLSRKTKGILYTSCSSKRNLNRAATSRCFMLSSVSLSICPFSMAAIRILHAKAPPFSFAGTAKSCGLDTRSYSGNVRTLPRFPAVYNPRKIKENDFPVSIRQR